MLIKKYALHACLFLLLIFTVGFGSCSDSEADSGGGGITDYLDKYESCGYGDSAVCAGGLQQELADRF